MKFFAIPTKQFTKVFPGQGPAWTGSRFKDSGPAWRDRRCDYAVAPQKEMFPRVYRLADSRPLGDWICDEFCIWDTEEIEPARSKPLKSHKVFDLNHSADRVYTIGTEDSHHMWWERSVPIVYTRLVEWLRSQTVWDGGFAPARVRFPPYLKCKIHHKGVTT